MPARLSARIRSLLRGLRDRDAVEAEMTEEFRHHLELRTADLVRDGLPREEAARQARLEFGHIDGHLIDARVSRGLAFFDQLRFSALDVRLGVRMLVKYPGLSLVSVIGMAVAIAIGVSVFSIIASMMDTTLPLPDGDRVVALRNTLSTDPDERSASLRDFAVWRQLKSVQDVAAFTTSRRNLVVPGVPVELVRVARMTASGFSLARTDPIMGRPLLAVDERSDARVVVVAYEAWQRRFAADPDIIGRRIGLGGDAYTIVGVMPEGFRFPVDERYWIPLVFGPAERAQEAAVSLTIAGRLAEGATFESTQVELGAIGTRLAAAYPATHGQMRPQVLHYTRAFFDVSPAVMWEGRLLVFFISLLLVLVAVNVSILVYARTATRVGEIAVRTALGASRARVVTQLFAEALVLSLTAAVVGLAIAGMVLARLDELVRLTPRVSVPFWVKLELSPGVIMYALGLAVLSAAIVGVVPALKATGRRVHTSLQQLAGRGTGMQLGRSWTALIIAQVAVAVTVLPFAVHVTQELIAEAGGHPGYPIAEFLHASLTTERTELSDDTTAAHRRAVEQRFGTRAAELIRRVESDAAVAGLTFGSAGSRERVEVEAAPGADRNPVDRGREDVERVAPDYFAVYGMPILAGRDFVAADAREGANAVIVNEVFVEDNLGSSAVLGRHLRFVRESDVPGEVEYGPWLEIVGVVRDLESTAYEPQGQIYLADDVARLSPPVSLAVRVHADPAMTFAPRLRAIAASVDPVLQLDGLISAAEAHRQGRRFARYIAISTAAVLLSVLLLSAAGIYAMMSFTVARRRREIGIRSALGAAPRRVLSGIFARTGAQLVAGILFGVIGTIVVDRIAGRGPVNDGNTAVLLFVAALMTMVGLLAAFGPARRALAVQPTEALREE